MESRALPLADVLAGAELERRGGWLSDEEKHQVIVQLDDLLFIAVNLLRGSQAELSAMLTTGFLRDYYEARRNMMHG